MRGGGGSMNQASSVCAHVALLCGRLELLLRILTNCLVCEQGGAYKTMSKRFCDDYKESGSNVGERKRKRTWREGVGEKFACVHVGRGCVERGGVMWCWSLWEIRSDTQSGPAGNAAAAASETES